MVLVRFLYLQFASNKQTPKLKWTLDLCIFSYFMHHVSIISQVMLKKVKKNNSIKLHG